MIKRNGIELMNERTKNVKLAAETQRISKEKHYISLAGHEVDINVLQDAAINGTVYFDESLPIKAYNVIVPVIEVTNETTASAGLRLSSRGQDVAVLNFASACNQGGGFLSGATAQEEDLCRCSGLYACLKSKPMFYNHNNICDSTLYTDGIIYSPNVPFFRDQYNVLLETPFTLSVITAPAPNMRSMSESEYESMEDTLRKTFLTRAKKVLQVAEAFGHKIIVLGAWGCGAFGNDPQLVATVFTEALAAVPAFEHVCFAVYDTREPPIVYELFSKIMNKKITMAAQPYSHASRLQSIAALKQFLRDSNPESQPNVLFVEDIRFGIVDKFIFDKQKPDKNDIYSNVKIIQKSFDSIQDLVKSIQDKSTILSLSITTIAYKPINDNYHYILIRELKMDKKNMEKYLLLV